MFRYALLRADEYGERLYLDTNRASEPPGKADGVQAAKVAVAAMQRHLEQGNDSLPVVIPLLLYHGTTSPYPYSTQWLDCFTDPELAESVYRQAFPLVNITAMPDDEILQHRRAALLELVQKHIRTRDMLKLAADIARLLNLWAIPKEQFRSLMYYIVGRGETSDTRQFLHTIAAQTQDYQEDVMTIAEQLRQEGEQRGIQKGIQLGEQKGRQESARSIARQMLARGMERDVVKVCTGLSDHDLDDLTN